MFILFSENVENNFFSIFALQSKQQNSCLELLFHHLKGQAFREGDLHQFWCKPPTYCIDQGEKREPPFLIVV